MGASVTGKNVSNGTVSEEEIDKLLEALDAMQIEFANSFHHNPDFLTTHNWEMCKQFWRKRNNNTPIEKTAAIDWRKPDGGRAILGENKAREHVDKMIKEKLLEEYFIPEISKRIKYVRATPTLYNIFQNILSTGVLEIKKRFA